MTHKRNKQKPVKHILVLEADATPADIAQIRDEAAKAFAPERVLVIGGPIKYYPVCRKRKPKVFTVKQK